MGGKGFHVRSELGGERQGRSRGAVRCSGGGWWAGASAEERWDAVRTGGTAVCGGRDHVISGELGGRGGGGFPLGRFWEGSVMHNGRRAARMAWCACASGVGLRGEGWMDRVVRRRCVRGGGTRGMAAAAAAGR